MFIDLQNYKLSLNNLLNYLRPFKRITNFNNLSFELPLSVFIFLIFLKLLSSKRMNLFYIILLIILPICCYILIHKIIIEKYYEVGFIRFRTLLFYDFFRLFFCSFLPFVLFSYMSFIIKLKSTIGLLTNVLALLYSTYIAGKLLTEYLLSISALNKDGFKIFLNSLKKDKSQIYFIYLVIYYLISHILNL